MFDKKTLSEAQKLKLTLVFRITDKLYGLSDMFEQYRYPF